MPKFNVVMRDECGDLFGVVANADTEAEAAEQAHEDYPECSVFNVEPIQKMWDRGWELQRSQH